MPAVVQCLAGLVDGFDIASGGELGTTLDTIMPAERISFAGPGKTQSELRSAIAAGIAINLESEREMETVARFGNELGLRPSVAVRVNPDFELKSSGMRMGGGAQQFGVDADRVPDMLKNIGALNLAFKGFHIFSGSQNLRVEALIEAQQKTIDLTLQLSDYAPEDVRHVNIGGGLGIPYFPGEAPLDLAPIGENLDRLLQAVARKLPNTKVIIELGRYIVGEAGIYVCRIVDRKVSRGQIFLITDGGLHHQLTASGNLGQVIRKNYPVAVGNRMDSTELEIASVVGCLCTPLDLLADKMEMPRAEVGDLIVIFQSGAYGLTASPTAFLSHPAPREVLV